MLLNQVHQIQKVLGQLVSRENINFYDIDLSPLHKYLYPYTYIKTIYYSTSRRAIIMYFNKKKDDSNKNNITTTQSKGYQ